MTSPINIHNNTHYPFMQDNTKYSCCSFCYSMGSEDYQQDPMCLLEYQTPPLDNIFMAEQDHPFSSIYLLNIFLVPDMKRYLQETSISDDIYNIPIHLQKLICEAKMEVSLCKQEEIIAYNKLLKLRNYIDTICDHDVASIISTLNQLFHDEDELAMIIV